MHKPLGSLNLAESCGLSLQSKHCMVSLYGTVLQKYSPFEDSVTDVSVIHHLIKLAIIILLWDIVWNQIPNLHCFYLLYM